MEIIAIEKLELSQAQLSELLKSDFSIQLDGPQIDGNSYEDQDWNMEVESGLLCVEASGTVSFEDTKSEDGCVSGAEIEAFKLWLGNERLTFTAEQYNSIVKKFQFTF